MKKLLTLILLLTILETHAAETTATDDPVLFYVNDEAITQSMFRQYYAFKSYQIPADPEQQKIQQNKVANELINIFLMSKKAEAEKLDQDYHAKMALEVARKNTLSKVLISKHLNKMKITDKEREDAYQEVLQQAAKRAEYKARFITLKDEAKARLVIEKLNKGDDFNELAKLYSAENFGKQDDDSLGWFTADTQEKEVAEAIQSLEAGKFTEKPVKSRFGWHVIIVDDKKITEVPPLEQMKNQLTSLIQQQKLRQEVAELRKSATIKTADQK